MKIASNILNLIFIYTLIRTIIFFRAKKLKIQKNYLLIILPISALIQSFFVQFIYILLSKKNDQIFEDYILYTYILIESLVFFNFFYNNLERHKIRRVVLFLSYLSIILFFLSIFENKYILKTHYSYLCVFQGLIMIFLALIALFDTVFDDQVYDLYKSPKFILSSGILILFSITFPINLISTYLIINNFDYFLILNNFTLLSYTIFYTYINKHLKNICE